MKIKLIESFDLTEKEINILKILNEEKNKNYEFTNTVFKPRISDDPFYIEEIENIEELKLVYQYKSIVPPYSTTVYLTKKGVKTIKQVVNFEKNNS